MFDALSLLGPASFDYAIHAQHKWVRNREAKSLSCLRFSTSSSFVTCSKGSSAGWAPLSNLVDESGGTSGHINSIGTVGDEAARLGNLQDAAGHGQTVFQRQFCDLRRANGGKGRPVAPPHRRHLLPPHETRCRGLLRFESRLAACRYRASCWSRPARSTSAACRGRREQKDRDAREAWKQLFH